MRYTETKGAIERGKQGEIKEERPRDIMKLRDTETEKGERFRETEVEGERGGERTAEEIARRPQKDARECSQGLR